MSSPREERPAARRRGRFAGAITAFLLPALLTPLGAGAVEAIKLEFASLNGDTWQAASVKINLRLIDSQQFSADVRLERLTLPPPIGALRDVRVTCPALEVRGRHYRCRQARAIVHDTPLDAVTFEAELLYDAVARRLTVIADSVPWRGKPLRVSAAWAPDGWALSVSANALALGEVSTALPATLAGPLADLHLDRGIADVAMSIGRAAGDAMHGKLSLDVTDLALGNAAGTIATDAVSASLELAFRGGGGPAAWDFTAELVGRDGEVYAEPVYLELGTQTVNLRAQGRYRHSARRLRLNALHFTHPQVLDAHLEAVVDLTKSALIGPAVLELRDLRLPGAYATYLQGLVVGTPLAKLETLGRLRGRLQLDGGAPRALSLHLQELSADDRERQFALYGLNGDIHWQHAPGEDRPSTLRWRGGFVYGVGYGAGEATVLAHGDDFALQEPLLVPVLDGALKVNALAVADVASASPAIDFDAVLEPVDLRRLSVAMGLPAFPGRLAGELPLLRLREGTVTLGGSLVARVFDGTVRIGDLRIDNPLGGTPVTTADITLEGLDLALVTDVITLGRIEGRLDGFVRDLVLVRARPAAFDAAFYTPARNQGRRRISRRALDNLTEIAGGGSALLSRGFLSFFREFGYRELGIRCRLEADRCAMGGVEPATGERGYVLVRGRGLPRIDVIGYSAAVDWPRLVAQIQQALGSRPSTQPADP